MNEIIIEITEPREVIGVIVRNDAWQQLVERFDQSAHMNDSRLNMFLDVDKNAANFEYIIENLKEVVPEIVVSVITPKLESGENTVLLDFSY